MEEMNYGNDEADFNSEEETITVTAKTFSARRAQP
jgi:hypothetical protein